MPHPASMTRLPLLDGLRGRAAICVMLCHVHNAFGTGRWCQSGYLAVDLFFLLSGFILTLIAEPRMARGLSAPAFFEARIRRLWPMIALGTLVGVAVQFVMLFAWFNGLAVLAVVTCLALAAAIARISAAARPLLRRAAGSPASLQSA